MTLKRISKVGVVGAGTMGQGIAEMLAVKNIEVFLVEKTLKNLEDAYNSIVLSLDKQIEKWAITQTEKRLILSKIHKVANLNRLAQCDMVIETITEDLAMKKDMFNKLDRICAPDVILVSNTSTLSLTDMAGETTRPERVAGMHFLHPVSKVDVVEIVRGLKTSEETMQTIKHFVEVVINKKGIMLYESPGFVTTRLICTLINEAVRTLEEGVASKEDIDEAMRIGYSFQHGPLEMCDRFGLDAVLAAMERMFREFGDIKYRPSFVLKRMVRAGQLGVKSGEGFFKYNKEGERI